MKNRVVFFLLIVSILVAASGCEKTSADNMATADNWSDNVTVVTVGDNSYIYINKYGRPADSPKTVLWLIENFSNTHPYLEIEWWSIEKQQYAYVTESYVYGLWIHHRPKE